MFGDEWRFSDRLDYFTNIKNICFTNSFGSQQNDFVYE